MRSTTTAEYIYVRARNASRVFYSHILFRFSTIILTFAVICNTHRHHYEENPAQHPPAPMRHRQFAQPSGTSTDSQQQQPKPRWPRFDPRHPDVHDPVMARGEDGRYYLFATGMGVSVMSSADRQEWQFEAPVLSPIPAWATDTVRGYRGHTWAPDICYANGLWHLYYSCSTFGKNGSAIGHAVNKTLDPRSPHFGWEDKGMVIASHRGKENWNAIDPTLSSTGRAIPTSPSARSGTAYSSYVSPKRTTRHP